MSMAPLDGEEDVYAQIKAAPKRHFLSMAKTTLLHTDKSSQRSPKDAALASFLPNRMKGDGAQASCVLLR